MLRWGEVIPLHNDDVDDLKSSGIGPTTSSATCAMSPSLAQPIQHILQTRPFERGEDLSGKDRILFDCSYRCVERSALTRETRQEEEENRDEERRNSLFPAIEDSPE